MTKPDKRLRGNGILFTNDRGFKVIDRGVLVPLMLTFFLTDIPDGILWWFTLRLHKGQGITATFLVCDHRFLEWLC